jgi:hypothetical protein
MAYIRGTVDQLLPLWRFSQHDHLDLIWDSDLRLVSGALLCTDCVESCRIDVTVPVVVDGLDLGEPRGPDLHGAAVFC